MTKMTVLAWGFAAGVSFAIAAPAPADVIPVVPGQSIQLAIDQAQNGDEIVVEAGTYTETICFCGKEIIVRSADGPGTTILDGNGFDTVVSCNQGEGPGTALRGFTIRNGRTISAFGGGGVQVIFSTLAIADCVFENNTAPQGGGVSCGNGSTATIVNCTFINNTADILHGAGLAVDDSDVVLINCSVLGNIATGGSFQKGGGIYGLSSSLEMTNCLFSGNFASSGGGLFLTGTTTTFNNCTIASNTADIGGAMLVQGNGDVTLRNSIVWANNANFDPHIAGAVTTRFCDISGGLLGFGNIDFDPLFVDADGPDNIAGTLDDDLRLALGSPCSDRGENDSLPVDTFDLDEDGDVLEPLPQDFAGNERVQVCLVDIGAIESASSTSDCNENGNPDICDIAEGGSTDCNQNGLPDDCEPDCDDDGTPDDCESVCGVDLIFLLDTSQSMLFELDAVCADLIQQVTSELQMPGVIDGQVRTTVYGITGVATPLECFDGAVAINVDSVVPGDPGESCETLTVAGGADSESWGPATAILADRFHWLEGALRVIILVSDEAPCHGGDCDAADAESIQNARNLAISNGVTVYPVMAFGALQCVFDLATTLVEGTPGRAFQAVQGVESYDSIGAELASTIITETLASCGNGIPPDCRCSGDVDGDNIVDVDDLVAVILAWNSSDPLADIDGSGLVDVDDLLAVILGWGTCGE